MELLERLKDRFDPSDPRKRRDLILVGVSALLLVVAVGLVFRGGEPEPPPRETQDATQKLVQELEDEQPPAPEIDADEEEFEGDPRQAHPIPDR